MKNNFKFFLLILTGGLLFAACSKDSDGPGTGAEPEADYTIMMYGCGGGNLDDALIYNLSQVESYGYSPKVQFTAKIKYSISQHSQDPDHYGGTRLYTLTPDGLEDERVGSQGYRLDDPQNLADFITEAQKRLPAKHYILVLWNHGSEFSISDQLVESSYPEKVDSRAVIFDDNVDGESLSIFEQEEAFKRANVKLDLLYWDVCLMNSMENLCQIKDYTRYVLGAGHVTPGFGGNYASLMYELENNPDLLSAMRAYVPATVENWVTIQDLGMGVDLVLSDMNQVELVAENLKKCIGTLISSRDDQEPGSQSELQYHYYNGTHQKTSIGEKYPYYSEEGLLYYFDDRKNSAVDLSSAFVRLGNITLDGEFSAEATKLKRAIDKMVRVSSCAGTGGLLSHVSVGINWSDKKSFEKVYDYPIQTMAGLYPHLRFDKLTGWSHFLKTNIRKTVAKRIVKDPITGAESFEYYEVPAEEPKKE